MVAASITSMQLSCFRICFVLIIRKRGAGRRSTKEGSERVNKDFFEIGAGENWIFWQESLFEQQLKRLLTNCFWFLCTFFSFLHFSLSVYLLAHEPSRSTDANWKEGLALLSRWSLWAALCVSFRFLSTRKVWKSSLGHFAVCPGDSATTSKRFYGACKIKMKQKWWHFADGECWKGAHEDVSLKVQAFAMKISFACWFLLFFVEDLQFFVTFMNSALFSLFPATSHSPSSEKMSDSW